jgi:hypothetical protein
MKRAVFLSGTACMLCLGLTLSGCGQNQAQNTVAEEIPVAAIDEPSASIPVEEAREVQAREWVARALQERERDLVVREEAIRQREESLAHRLDEIEDQLGKLTDIEKRERALAEREEALLRREAVEPSPSEPEPVVRTVWVTLPATSAVEVEFLDALSSESNLAGDPVRVRVTRDVSWDGVIVIPAGSEIVGTVAEANPQKKIGGQARLSMAFERIVLSTGGSLPISAHLDVQGKKQAKKDAATIGGSAAGGAVVGRVLSNDKSKGTAIGAILGGAIGTAVAMKNAGDPVSIEPGAMSHVVLDAPLEVAVEVTEPPGRYAQARSR